MTTAERKQRTRRKEDGLGMVQGQTPQGSAAGNSAAETLKTEAEGSRVRWHVPVFSSVLQPPVHTHGSAPNHNRPFKTGFTGLRKGKHCLLLMKTKTEPGSQPRSLLEVH